MQGILFYTFILVSVYSDCVIFYGDTDITVYACSCMQCNRKQRTVSVCVCVCVVLSTEADRRLYLTHDNVPDRRRPLVHQPVARLLFSMFYILAVSKPRGFLIIFRTVFEQFMSTERLDSPPRTYCLSSTNDCPISGRSMVRTE